MTGANDNSHPADPIRRINSVGFGEIWRIVWNGKWLIVSIGLVATIAAVVVALMMPNIYRAEALLAPNQQDDSAGLSALSGRYSGLAGLAGINLSQGRADKTNFGLETLRSRKFVSDFIDRHAILVPLMASRGWDESTGELLIDPDIYDLSNEEWVRQVSPPRKTIPSHQEAYKFFRDNVLSVSQNESTGFVTVAVMHHSPTVAKQWVEWLVQDINESIMRQDVLRAKEAIDYLNEKIQATAIGDMRNVFSRLIEEQTKTVMLARINDEYLFKTIDPAVVPELKAKPRRAVFVIASAAISGVLAVLLVVGLAFGREARRASSSS